MDNGTAKWRDHNYKRYTSIYSFHLQSTINALTDDVRLRIHDIQQLHECTVVNIRERDPVLVVLLEFLGREHRIEHGRGERKYRK